MFGAWIRPWRLGKSWAQPLAATFQAASSASVDELWQQIADLADVSWHPMLSRTNVPNGLLPKPGLIFRAVTRLSPFPIQIFVEQVDPKALLSVRVIALPGVEERGIYRIESTVWGTRVSYSVTLTGWLSPLIWSIIRPYAAQVAAALAEAAEQPLSAKRDRRRFQELLSAAVLLGSAVSRL